MNEKINSTYLQLQG
jgi:hypothetical protein